jgi:hypothetical protein
MASSSNGLRRKKVEVGRRWKVEGGRGFRGLAL